MSLTEQRLMELRTAAATFRVAIERCPKSCLPITFPRFPAGACGDAAPLLARFLRERGFGEFVYVCGSHLDEAGTGTVSHAWLRQGDLIVDITADQFPDVTEPVVVTTDLRWYATFPSREEHAADIDGYDPQTSATLGRAYQKVTHHLPVA